MASEFVRKVKGIRNIDILSPTDDSGITILKIWGVK